MAYNYKNAVESFEVFRKELSEKYTADGKLTPEYKEKLAAETERSVKRGRTESTGSPPERAPTLVEPNLVTGFKKSRKPLQPKLTKLSH